MRPTEHDLNSLRNIIRNLQEENAGLKKLLNDNGISYDTDTVIDSVEVRMNMMTIREAVYFR